MISPDDSTTSITEPADPKKPTGPTEVEVTRILTAIEAGEPHRAAELLPLVYNQLRYLARSKLSSLPPGQTLQATALVHEAYLRIEKSSSEDSWQSRGHFFAAAAESMRRIIIDNIRRKQRKKRGGDMERADIDVVEIATGMKDDQLLAVDEALEKLEAENAEAAALVKLRFFGGLTLVEAANALEISERTAKRRWSYARAWLFDAINEE